MEAMPDREVGHFFCPAVATVQVEIPRPNFTSFSITKVELVKFGCCFTVLARNPALAPALEKLFGWYYNMFRIFVAHQ